MISYLRSVSLPNSVLRLFGALYTSLRILPPAGSDELSLLQELPTTTASGWVSQIILASQALFVDGASENI